MADLTGLRERLAPGRLIDALLPPTCALCGAPGAGGRDLCTGCAAALPYNRHVCPRCALPVAIPLTADTLCGTCQRRPPPFARAIAAFRYETPIPTLMGGIKFHGRLNHARLLGQLLADAIQEYAPPMPQVLIPVPLHPARLAARGFNQSLEIARVVARVLDLPVASHCCRRVRRTPPQTGLDEPARRRNIRGAFVAQPPLPWRHVVILDDVVTTGSTVGELALALRRAGAESVAVWAVARTP